MEQKDKHEISVMLNIHPKNIHKHYDMYIVKSFDSNQKLQIAQSCDLKDLFKKYSIEFIDCVFELPILCQEIYERKIAFSSCIFMKDFCFLDCIFLDLKFEKIIFKDKFSLIKIKHLKSSSFSQCIFEKEARFEQNIFTNEVFFDRSIFNHVTISKTFFEAFSSFYFVTFKQPPLLENCVFNKHLTTTGSKLQQKEYEFISTLSRLSSTQDKPEELLQSYREGFCSIKNALIKNNNLLDASSYHKVELCCKELELDSNTKKSPREWIDWAQLFFYRNTSDHHTDTLKSFHTLIALIGVFGLLCGAIVLGFDYFAFDYKGGLDILSLKEAYSSHIKTSIQSHTWEYFLGNLALILVFIGLFLGVVWKCSRDILIPLGYVMTLGFLATSPKYLIPAMSLFGGGRAVLDPLGIVGGVYTLLFGFLAYSFIKTIRKNSIIPS